MNHWTVLLSASCVGLALADKVLRIGGPLGSGSTDAKGKIAFEAFKAWANGKPAGELGYTVDLTFVAGDYAEVAKNMTDPAICNPKCVDVLLTPYGSGNAIKAIGGVPAASTVPIMVWGGASDTIFSSACTGKKCFGTFTKGSQYLVAGLDAIAATAGAAVTVGLIQNDNAFSASVCSGAKTHIEAATGLSIVKEVTVAKGVLSAADKTKVGEVITAAPDVVAICGHSGGDVEDVVMEIGKSAYRPKAILGTNTITSSAQTRFDSMTKAELMQCTAMPTQWAKPTTVDPVVGWTSTAFSGVMAAAGDTATYHAASAGAAMIAVANAYKAGKDASDAGLPGTLATHLAAVDVASFYGPISFAADGSIANKPMYVEQRQVAASGGDANVIVAPTPPATATMKYPMSDCYGWKTPAPTIKIGGPIQSTSTGGKGKAVFESFKDWSMGAHSGFTVDLTTVEYNADTVAEVAKNMTDPTICSPKCVDVFLTPYTSGAATAAIGGVPSGSSVPIMVWGGASDAIFSTACTGRKCFGTFTKGSQYLVEGLKQIHAKAAGDLTVALVQNDNGFSKSVCAGAKAYIEATAGLSVKKESTVTKGTLSDADKTEIQAVITAAPDVVAICGHSGGDVEDVIITIGDSSFRPKAIIGTNSITSGAKSRFTDKSKTKYMECVMMPTQWNKPEVKDEITALTSTGFVDFTKTKLGGADQVTYHAASAGGAFVAAAHGARSVLANHGGDMTKLSTAMAGLDISTFYGPIKFNADGSIGDGKPMYVQQSHSGANAFVTAANMKYPLSACDGWAAAGAGGPAPTPAPAPAPADGDPAPTPAPAPAPATDVTTTETPAGAQVSGASNVAPLAALAMLVALVAARTW